MPPAEAGGGAQRAVLLLSAGAVTGAVVALVVRRREPVYSGFEPTDVADGGVDPYARPPSAPHPAEPPITTMTEAVATDLGSAAVEAIPDPAGNGETTGTIDVTDEPISLGTDEAGGAARTRRRTRRGESQ